jgi:mRNA-degrading endonuclease YafQ of YafQ-DinJ toxin-antitoxin module
MEISFAPNFIRQLKKLEPKLKEEAFLKIELFQDNHQAKSLKIHKLKGRLKDRFSFSVNYEIRIIFLYASKNEISLLAIGGHNVYKN